MDTATNILRIKNSKQNEKEIGVLEDLRKNDYHGRQATGINIRIIIISEEKVLTEYNKHLKIQFRLSSTQETKLP